MGARVVGARVVGAAVGAAVGPLISWSTSVVAIFGGRGERRRLDDCGKEA